MATPGTPFDQRDGFIWFNGELVPWSEAQLHVLSHALHYASSVFEGERAYGGKIFRSEDHSARLQQSANMIDFEIPWTIKEIEKVKYDVLRANGLTDAYVRVLAWRGAGQDMGVASARNPVRMAVAAWEWGAYLGAENMQKGLRIKTSSFTRHHVNITMCKAKSNGNYINSMMALQEAMRDGYDEALLLDVDGFVAEGSGENIFIIKDGVIYTPELTSALDGITRKTLIQLATDEGFDVGVKRITRDEVYIADEAFFTGTAAEVTPIRELDGRAIGSGTRGPITEKLQSRYFDVVHGRVEKYNHWLSYV